MAKFTMLIGIQGSGKSTYAKNRAFLKENVRVISSDAIREAVLGDRQDQCFNPMVFDIMNRSVKNLLDKDIDVIYDATNINSKRRMALLKTLPKDTVKRAIFFPCSLETAVNRNRLRPDNEQVRIDVITRTYKALDVPMSFEGFDTIDYAHHGGAYRTVINDANSIVQEYLSQGYVKYHTKFLFASVAADCIDFAQDNPNHTFSVGKHMYHTYKKLLDGKECDRLILAGALHDCGKPICREYKEDGYACFYGHEKVSAQKAIQFLMELNCTKTEITYISTLINLHMRMHQESGRDKLFDLVGEDMFYDLLKLNEADSTAK